MPPESVVSNSSPEVQSPEGRPEGLVRPLKSTRWDKKIASIGFGVALLLAIACFATLMGSNQKVNAQTETQTNIPAQR